MKSVKFINSVTIQVLVLLVAVSIAVAVATIMAQLKTEKESIYDKYASRASVAARLAASKVPARSIEYYLGTQEIDDEYFKLLDTLRIIQIESGMPYLYITKVTDTGEIYVFDTDTVDPLPVGYFSAWSEAGVTEAQRKSLLAGEKIGTYTVSNKWGEFLTAREPIYKEDGTLAGYVGVNFFMDIILDNISQYARKTISTALLIFLASMLVTFYVVYRVLTVPLRVLTANIGDLKPGTVPKEVLGGKHNELALLEDTFIKISEMNSQLVRDIDYKSSLLGAINKATVLMLNLGMDSFESSLIQSMKLIAEALGVDSIHLWKNKNVDNTNYYYKVFEWSSDKAVFEDGKICSYDVVPGWEDILLSGEILNSLVKDLSVKERAYLAPNKVLSILVIPIFTEGQFWGFVRYSDCKKERIFTEDEEISLTTGSSMIVNAFIRHEMIEDIKRTSEKLEGTFSTLESIMNGLDSLLLVTDPKTSEILFMNEYMKAHFGIDDSYIGKRCYEVFHGFDAPCEFCPQLKLNADPDKEVIWEQEVNGVYYRRIDRYIKWPDGRIVDLQASIDITEMRAAEQELLAAKELAEESNRSKSIFLASMSHEIRTPMNAILGVAEIQMQSDLTDEVKEAMNMIYDSGNLLLNIVNDILDLSKIEAGRMEIAPVKYDIPSIINDTVQLVTLRYESKPIEFKLDVDPAIPLYLHGDELRIKQILNNILSNAFKYTDTGEITLRMACERVDDENIILIMSVKDTGQGMNSDQLNRLFEEYSRFNMRKNRSTVGTGLGLNITKRLIDMMHGDVKVESEPGKGTEFIVRLPQRQLGIDLCGVELSERMKGLNFQRTSSKREQILYENLSYGKVLVVDDVKTNLYVAKGLLLPYQLKISLAESGFETVELIKSGKEYDIIFMDHMMPYMDGIETVKKLRDAGYKKPIVALTANALTGQAEVFMQNGFDGFMSKPIDIRELKVILNKLIRNKRLDELKEEIQGEVVESSVSDISTVPNLELDSEFMDVFLEDVEDAVEYLEGFLKDGGRTDLEMYITVVHGIKSALANVGVVELSKVAASLEKNGKQGEVDDIMIGTPELIYSLKGIINKYKRGCED